MSFRCKTVPLRVDMAPPIRVCGVMIRSTTMRRKSLSLQAKPRRETSISTTPTEKMICRTPKEGMRTKTVKKVPKMLPPVEME